MLHFGSLILEFPNINKFSRDQFNFLVDDFALSPENGLVKTRKVSKLCKCQSKLRKCKLSGWGRLVWG